MAYRQAYLLKVNNLIISFSAMAVYNALNSADGLYEMSYRRLANTSNDSRRWIETADRANVSHARRWAFLSD